MAKCVANRSLYNVLIVSVAFMILFCAYNSLQNYVTSLFPGNLGNESLAVLYGSVAVTVFFAPAMVEQLGSRITMIVGSAMYVAYMASLIQIHRPVVLVMSVVIGFGAAVLWVALGVFITQNSTDDTYGRNTGLFWSIFSVSQILGNLLTYLVFRKVESDTTLYVGFTVVGAVGFAGLFLLRAPMAETGSLSSSTGLAAVTSGTTEVETEDSISHVATRLTLRDRWIDFGSGVLHSLTLLGTPKMLLLVPLMFFSGMELSFWTGEFPQLLPADVIGLVLTFAGIGEVLGGYLMGRLGDAAGRSAAVLAGVLFYSVGLGLSVYVHSGGDRVFDNTSVDAPLSAFFAALCFGLGDSAFNTNIYSMISQLYNKDAALVALPSGESEHLLGHSTHNDDTKVKLKPSEKHTHSVRAFTIFQLVQNLGSAFGYYYAVPCPLHGSNGTLTQVWVQIALIVSGAACFVALDRSQRKLIDAS